MDKDWLSIVSGQNQLQAVMKTNQFTEKFGLVLSEEDTGLLLRERRDSLKNTERVEFGEGILPKLIYAFCDSPYISQDNYADTIGRLQDIFYGYKNEVLDELTDDELIELMKDEFNGSCQGSLELLECTALEELGREIREGIYEEEEMYEADGMDIVRWEED